MSNLTQPGTKVIVDWQDSTRSGEVVGVWPWAELQAKYTAIGISPEAMEAMVSVRFDDIGVRVVPIEALREPLDADLEPVYRAGFERGLRMGKRAGKTETFENLKEQHPWLSKLLRRRLDEDSTSCDSGR